MLLEETKANDRRFSQRWETDKSLAWRRHHGKKIRITKLIQRSLNSIALLIPEGDVPPVGSLLHPADLSDELRHGFRLAIVRRIESSDVGQVVFVEILA